MRSFLIGVLFLAAHSGFSQQVQSISKPFQADNGAYGTIEISTKPQTFGGASILIQMDALRVEGLRKNGKTYSGNQLSKYGIQFPFECTDCYFSASGRVSMLVPGSIQRDYGTFAKSGTVHKGGFLKTNQEVIFSEDAKRRHNENKENGSAWENTGRVEELNVSGVAGMGLNEIANAVDQYERDLSQNSSGSQAPGNAQNGSNQSGSAPNGANSGSTQPSFNSLAEFNAYKERVQNSKKNQNTSPAKNVHQEHVRKNNDRYVQNQEQQRISETSTQQQVEEFHRNQLQAQQREMQRQKEAYERQQQEWYDNFQAQLEQNRIDQQNLNAAGDVAAQQAAAGNYQQAGMTYGMELANQGEAEAAIASMAIGTGVQIWSEISKERKKKKAAEARRLEQQRIQREREQQRDRKRAELLRRQKRQFETMVAAQRQAKKSIISSRTGVFAKEESYTKTFDKFSRSGEPIYIFFVETNSDYKEYKERVSFPDQVDIRIKEKARLEFSPMIRIYPNSSGEYPFLKAILDKIENEFVQKSGTTYKVYNWSPTLEEAQESYKSASEKAISAHFTPAFPEELLVDFNDSSKENNQYWTDAGAPGAGNTSKADQTLDYWNSSMEADSLKLISPEKEKTDYWKVQEKKENPKVRKPEVKKEKKVDYWN